MKHKVKNRRVHEISLQLLNKDQIEDIPKEDDWLSDQFSRPPFVIYKFCLVLIFMIALCMQPNLTLPQFKGIDENIRLGLALVSICSILVLLGCVEMLIAMVKRKSQSAQKSLVKFKYSLAGVIFGIIVLRKFQFDFNKSFLFQISVSAAFPLSICVGIIGGMAAVGIFKKNHPLERWQYSQETSTDFLEQNEVISSELLKYDKQLNRWPYKIYKIWLRFVIVITIMSFLFLSFAIMKFWNSPDFRRLKALSFLILLPLTAFCCYEMEIVLKSKNFEKSKQALFHLKTCILGTIILATIDTMSYSEKLFVLRDLSNFVLFLLMPLITLIGASRIHKIIEQRDQFARVSSYSEDHYL